MKYKTFYENHTKALGEDLNISKHDIYRLKKFNKIIEKKIKSKSIKILDIGSRNAWLKQFLNKNYSYETLDISSHYVKLMNDSGIKSTLGDICTKTSFKKDSFDIIVLGEILEHLPNCGAALEECSRILKKDGMIIGSVPNVWSIGYFIKILFQKDIEPSGQHVHLFDRYHFRNLCNFYDFKILNLWEDQFTYALTSFPKINYLLCKYTKLGTNLFFILKNKENK